MEEKLTIQIAKAIAEQRGVGPMELDYTLQDYIETDALELLASSDTDHWTLSFECPDGTVTVTGNGGIHIDLADETEPLEAPVTVD